MGNSDEMLERILAGGPSPDTLHVLLSKRLAEGRYGDVIRESLKALSVYPDDIRLRSLLSQAYLKTGFIGLAQAELETAAAHLDQLASIYKLQAEVYARQNRPSEAAEAVNRFLAIHPNDPEALALREKVAPPHGNATAIAEEALLSGEPEAATKLSTPTLAEIYYNQGRVQDAIDTYERVLQQHPRNEKAAERLSELRAEAGYAPVTAAHMDDRIRAKKEKVMGILETWLDKIKAIDDI
ncbi:MAG: tetratricopeptide repeat protein [Deltaproteobacteria bacterium]|nr:tetratricopeptide repeat protein [Deltaproteobacteria bacterium]